MDTSTRKGIEPSTSAQCVFILQSMESSVTCRLTPSVLSRHNPSSPDSVLSDKKPFLIWGVSHTIDWEWKERGGGREGGAEGGRKGGAEGGREGGAEGGREGGRGRGRERGAEGGREGGRERGREGETEEQREGGREGQREGGRGEA